MQKISLGAAGVGKSCLLKQYCGALFDEDYQPTIMDTYKKTEVIQKIPYDLGMFQSVVVVTRSNFEQKLLILPASTNTMCSNLHNLKKWMCF